jgi:uncharacterized protein
MDIIHSLAPYQWALGVACALMVGLSKTGIPGIGILFVPLFAMVLPARLSTGAMLPLLIVGDIFAVSWYRRSAVWRHLARLLPWAVAGIVVGFFAMRALSDSLLRPVIGVVVIVLLGVSFWRDTVRKGRDPVPTAWWFAAAMGLVAGATTMLANAGGPVMIVFLLAMRLPKDEFLGTSAWFFAIVNLIKIPFSAGLGLITPSSLLLDACLAGGVLVGSVVGVLTAQKLPERAFTLVVQFLALGSAILLFF